MRVSLLHVYALTPQPIIINICRGTKRAELPLIAKEYEPDRGKHQVSFIYNIRTRISCILLLVVRLNHGHYMLDIMLEH